MSRRRIRLALVLAACSVLTLGTIAGAVWIWRVLDAAWTLRLLVLSGLFLVCACACSLLVALVLTPHLAGQPPPEGDPGLCSPPWTKGRARKDDVQ